MSLFEITRASILFFPKILDAVLSFTKVKIFLIPLPLNCLKRLTWVLKCEKLYLENRREFIRHVTKIVPEWNCHLEIFSLPQAIENSRQFVLLRTDILQKTVVGCPCRFLRVKMIDSYRSSFSRSSFYGSYVFVF